jgi:hypothetical protein
MQRLSLTILKPFQNGLQVFAHFDLMTECFLALFELLSQLVPFGFELGIRLAHNLQSLLHFFAKKQKTFLHFLSQMKFELKKKLNLLGALLVFALVLNELLSMAQRDSQLLLSFLGLNGLFVVIVGHCDQVFSQALQLFAQSVMTFVFDRF